ncbi:hypothetical protein AAHA92_31543 [Salvia divinorum]|uniref:Uncharacterized protein n=1 Tax=Salvia divinorum TaxID=28513 RepID=A0ABD1FKX6_SALDI
MGRRHMRIPTRLRSYYEEEKKSSKFGRGMGTGLAVGAVAGGCWVDVDALEEHIADDVVDDAGYDDEDY